jgi:hypothetical protein
LTDSRRGPRRPHDDRRLGLLGRGRAPPEPLHHLLYANGTAVRHVMTDGRLQVFDGRLVADEAEVLDAGGRAVQTVWQQLDREGWFR